MSIEAMKLALEALEEVQELMHTSDWFNTRTDALRAAIEQAEKQEPVAWMTHTEGMMPLFHMSRKSALNWQTQPTPLYTAPPRQWQGLTYEDIAEAGQLNVEGERMLPYSFARAIEAKLKERNA